MTADLHHIATADIGPLHCVLYRDAEGRHEVHVYARGEGSWSSRWIGALRVTGATPPLDALAKALAWARREVRDER